MDELELNISNVLTEVITLDEFEHFIYQEFYVDQIQSNEFISKVININYRSENWKNELEKLIYDIWDETKCLTHILRNYCMQIIETDDPEAIYNIVSKISILNNEYDYEYDTLMQFYRCADELDLISCGISSISIENLLFEIKTYAKKYTNAYSMNIDVLELLNLKEDINTTYKPKKSNNYKIETNSLKKKVNSKKWFQFWK